jgi:hypothetical protein
MPDDSENPAQPLADVSRRILAAADELRRLERESRTMRPGSREFALISAEIETRSKLIFRMATEQRSLAEIVPPQDRTLEELDERED